MLAENQRWGVSHLSIVQRQRPLHDRNATTTMPFLSVYLVKYVLSCLVNECIFNVFFSLSF